MPVINLSTYINAPGERCFDLSRSIDIHIESTSGTHEKAIAGITSGLIGFGEEVTWRAKHLGVYQNLTSRITEYQYPETFTDSMVKGAFKRFDHQHIFLQEGDGTLMKDIFDFESPFGIFGKFVNTMFLTNYMRGFLVARNNVIKEIAEGRNWMKYING